jgi:hypothetical protein
MTITDQLLYPDAASPTPSPYDTAWVAMVPSSSSASPRAPRFPRCLDWVLRNQNADGSWGAKLDGACTGDDDRTLVVKNALSATLACVLALTTWGVGGGHVRKDTSWFDGFTFSRRRLNGTRAPRAAVRYRNLTPVRSTTHAGLRFIGHNYGASFLMDDGCGAPAGFNVIFPDMLARGISMGPRSLCPRPT